MNDKVLEILSKGLNNIVVGGDEPNETLMPPEIEAETDIPYKTRDGKILFMDVFKPKTEPGVELPVVIDVHGGGLIAGNKELDRGLSIEVAKRGYLVCSLEYRLVPAVNIYEQVADICAGMDFVGRHLLNYDVDYTRIYMLAESAGAYLATYATAMRHSRVLQKAIGYEASAMRIKAMAMLGGMFYTRQRDVVGIMASTFYGKDERARNIAPYTNPEHPQVIYNLPPCLLVTSKADFLRKYSYEFGRALRENDIDYEILDMGDDKKLKHVFAVVHPEYPESQSVIDAMDRWFRKY